MADLTGSSGMGLNTNKNFKLISQLVHGFMWITENTKELIFYHPEEGPGLPTYHQKHY